MRFDSPLQSGTFLKRYKRFFADIKAQDQVITAHCPNTGSLMGLKEPGSPCLYSTTDDPKRKLKHTLQMIKTPESWVGVNTGLPNKLAVELFESKKLPHWQAYDSYQSEVKISAESRIDLVLWKQQDHEVKKWNVKNLTHPLRLVEVKNVTLAENGVALFPDAVTTRGQKHLQELIDFKRRGFDCEMLYVVQRTDCHTFCPAQEIDPTYAEKLKEAFELGVTITALPCTLNASEVALQPKTLKLRL